jgi:hypothetical protein
MRLFGMAADIQVAGVAPRRQNWLKAPALMASAFTLSRPLCMYMWIEFHISHEGMDYDYDLGNPGFTYSGWGKQS